MKRVLIFLIISFSALVIPDLIRDPALKNPSSFHAEETIFKQKQPKQNASQLKMELGTGLQDLLQQCTKSMRTITTMIDDIVVHAKQLTGEQDGAFATNDKEQLKLHIKKIGEMQKVLQNVTELQL